MSVIEELLPNVVRSFKFEDESLPSLESYEFELNERLSHSFHLGPVQVLKYSRRVALHGYSREAREGYFNTGALMFVRRFLGDSWTYISGCEKYRFVLSRDLRDEERSRVVSAMSAEYVIDAGLDHHWNAHILEDMHEAVRPGYSIGFAPRKEDILPEVLEAIRQGELVAFQEEWTPPPQWFGREEPVAKPPPPPEDPAPGTFDLRVVLDGDGSGVRQLSLGVKTKGEGEFRARRTNGVGSIFVDLVVRGAADVRSDIKGARLDQSAGVVGWGSSPIQANGAAGAEAENSSQIRFLVELEEYRVRDGDTTQSVARKAGMSWEDLAYFNWGTRVPEEINHFLVFEVGSTQKSESGAVAFKSSDQPGIIRIPRNFSKSALPTDTKNVLRVRSLRFPFGRCFDMAGQPIAGTRFVVSENGNQLHSGTTDSNGWLVVPFAWKDTSEVHFPF